MLKSTVASIIGVCGLVFCVVGVLVVVYFQDLVGHIINKRLVLAKGSESVYLWSKPPIHPQTKVYFFNYTNAKDVEMGAKPVIKEVGPYVYEETLTKKNLSWDDSDETVSYLQERLYRFVPELSIGSDTDSIISFHPLMLGSLASAKMYGSALISKSLSAMLSVYNITLFTNHTVHDWLWGFPEEFLTLARQVDPSGYPFDHFGYFYKKNGTHPGLFTAYTGSFDIRKKSMLKSYNRSEQLRFWKSPCNAVNGTDGTSFGASLNRNDVLYIFSPDLCRSIPLVYQKDVAHHGINAFRYIVSPKTFSNHLSNPDNICFCTSSLETCERLPEGLFNVSACKFKSPVLLSWPHFLHGDPSLRKDVVGLSDDADTHQGYMDIQPNLGISMQAWFRMQINFMFYKIEDVKDVSNVSFDQIVLPALWFETGIEGLSPDVYALLRKATQSPKIAETAMTYTFLVLGGLMVLFVLLFFVQRSLRDKQKFSEKELQFITDFNAKSDGNVNTLSVTNKDNQTVV